MVSATPIPPTPKYDLPRRKTKGKHRFRYWRRLCYSGNYKLFFDTDDSDYHHFFAGINEENSAYTLKAKESFRTPELALTYSKDGLSGSSRNFHAWARKHKIANGATARKILLNSWEGVYFDINQEGMDQMMSDIQSMGGELFVMDDGWFGDKYPRNKDNSSLGDWMVDARKLPRGIEGLIADATSMVLNSVSGSNRKWPTRQVNCTRSIRNGY